MPVEEQTQYNMPNDLYSGYWIEEAQRLTIPDRRVTKLGFWMHKVGAPTGDAIFEIRRVSDDGVIVSKVWGDASSLPAETGYVEATFDSAIINEEVRILCRFEGGDSSNKLRMYHQNTDVKADEYTSRRTANGWSDTATWDTAYRYTYGPDVLTVSIQAMTDITIAHGTVETLGETPCTQHGHCWSTSPTPTIADNKTQLGAASAPHAFESALTGLLPNKTYYVRAYATDGGGTVYSSELSFSTWVGADSIDRSASLGNDTENIRWLIELSNPAFKNGYIAEVEAYLTQVAPGYTGYLGVFYQTDGGVFSSRSCVEVAFPASDGLKTWTGLSLPIQRGEYIAIGLPIAPNAEGTFGVDVDASGGEGVKHGAFPGVTCPVTNESFSEYSGVIMSLKGIFGIAPAVTTNPATALSAIAATPNGKLDSDGGEVCQCGFEWGLDTGYGVTTPPQSKTTGETFSQVIGGLFPGTTYHFRAFATNSVGTSHGADRSFATALVISRAFALAREEL